MERLREKRDQLSSEASVAKPLDRNAIEAMAKKKEDALKVISKRAPNFSVLPHYFGRCKHARCAESCLSQEYRNRCYLPPE